MRWRVLIAHAPGEEDQAERLAQPILGAGYDVHHQGLVAVGESLVGETSNLLATGGPVVLCGTVRAAGSKWARKIVQAARSRPDVQVLIVQMEEDADVEPLTFGERIAPYYRNPNGAIEDLLDALRQSYPLDEPGEEISLAPAAERRYWELALATCDIIDLANLPEGDRHIAFRRLELRRLYVPLRVQVEAVDEDEPEEASLADESTGRETVLSPFVEEGSQESATGPELHRLAKFLKGYRQYRRLCLYEEKVPYLSGERVAVGEPLAEARHLVVLGDPGAGKSTLLRWLATAYLLRLKRDPEWKELPDVATLPDEGWLPVLLRCRDLDAAVLAGPLESVLGHMLRKTEMEEREITPLLAHLRRKMDRGEVLLLIDGLDEITDTGARIRFCRQMERVTIAYKRMPIVVTSRIVGYREMGYRIRLGFQHLIISELSHEEKDDFARRWCALTEQPDRRAQAVEDLIRAIHSTDRIERLAGSPMLLTTLALVKRKVGKLPRRRAELYWEAVQVLLNWRSEVDDPLDPWEALPQLEYVAFAMCDRGVQRLRQDEILGLLEAVRQEYPQVHAIHAREPLEILRLLERRTGILVEIGEEKHLGMLIPVYEFRHLTFQEYLAARALVDGCFPGRNRNRSLAEHVGQLAQGNVVRRDSSMWQEPLRLCSVCCRTGEVDQVLLAILTPLPGESEANTNGRVTLAALCLSDEPNVSEEVARKILRSLVINYVIYRNAHHIPMELEWAEKAELVLAAARWVTDRGPGNPFREATLALSDSHWGTFLRTILLQEFKAASDPETRREFGDLLGELSVRGGDGARLGRWVRALREPEDEAISAVLAILAMPDALREETSEFVEGGLRLLAASPPAAAAGAQLLSKLHNLELWRPEDELRRQLVALISDPTADLGMVRYLVEILGKEREPGAVNAMLSWLGTEDHLLHLQLVAALGRIGNPLAVEPLCGRMASQNSALRRAAARALTEICYERSFEHFLEMLASPDREVLLLAISALGRLGDHRAVGPLDSLLRAPDLDVKVAAIQALGHIGDLKIVERVEPFLDQLDFQVREAAAAALGRIGSRRTLELLRPRLSAGDRGQRTAALGGLAQELNEPDRKLLTSNLDGDFPFLDPAIPIRQEWLDRAVRKLELPIEEIRERLEQLASAFPLKLAWRESDS